jgi:hypothetical protein
MRKILGVILSLAGLAPFALGGGRWQLRISGGPGWISPDDLNVFLRDYVRIEEAESGSTARGPGFKTVGGAANFEATLFIPIEPRIHLLASFGLIRAGTTGNEFTVTYPAVDTTYSRDDWIRDCFGRVGIIYSLPISDRLCLRPYAAGELHGTTFKETGSWVMTSLSSGERELWMDWTVRTHAFKPGFSAGLEIEFAASSSFRLSVDAGYRRAKMTGFKGDFHYEWNYPGGGYSDDQVEVPLYYYEFEESGEGPVYGTLNTPDVWGGNHLTLVRDAVIDLSGFYLKAGLGIVF